MHIRSKRWRLGTALLMAVSLCPAQTPNPLTLPENTSRRPVPQELKPYLNARSIVDLHEAELIKAYPELRG